MTSTALKRRFVEAGVWVRPFRNIVYLTPAFTIGEDELDQLTEAIVRRSRRGRKQADSSSLRGGPFRSMKRAKKRFNAPARRPYRRSGWRISPGPWRKRRGFRCGSRHSLRRARLSARRSPASAAGGLRGRGILRSI